MRNVIWISSLFLFAFVSVACGQSGKPEPPKPAEPASPQVPAPGPGADIGPSSDASGPLPTATELVTELQEKYEFPKTCHLIKDVEAWMEDGEKVTERWEVFMHLPGRMRVDKITSPGLTLISDFGKQTVFTKDNSRTDTRHPAYPILLLFDVMQERPNLWLLRVKSAGFDVDAMHIQPWGGESAYYVLGADSIESTAPGLWLDRETLLPHLYIIENPEADTEKHVMVQSLEYKKFPGGYMFPTVLEMLQNGLLVRRETVREAHFDMDLDKNLFDPDVEAANRAAGRPAPKPVYSHKLEFRSQAPQPTPPQKAPTNSPEKPQEPQPPEPEKKQP
jgi:hypothetical protein